MQSKSIGLLFLAFIVSRIIIFSRNFPVCILVPELLKTIKDILFELQFVRSAQLSVHLSQSQQSKLIVDQVLHPASPPEGLWSPQLQNTNTASFNSVAEAEFADRTDFYHKNQSHHRGLPFDQWKLHYLKI